MNKLIKTSLEIYQDLQSDFDNEKLHEDTICEHQDEQWCSLVWLKELNEKTDWCSKINSEMLGDCRKVDCEGCEEKGIFNKLFRELFLSLVLNHELKG